MIVTISVQNNGCFHELRRGFGTEEFAFQGEAESPFGRYRQRGQPVLCGQQAGPFTFCGHTNKTAV